MTNLIKSIKRRKTKRSLKRLLSFLMKEREMDIEKELHRSAQIIVSELCEGKYELRKVVRNRIQYLEIINNLTNNFINSALLMVEFLKATMIANGKISSENDHYRLCLTVTETISQITEYNIKQIKESYYV
jgi:hypothetical protein